MFYGLSFLKYYFYKKSVWIDSRSFEGFHEFVHYVKYLKNNLHKRPFLGSISFPFQFWRTGHFFTDLIRSISPGNMERDDI